VEALPKSVPQNKILAEKAENIFNAANNKSLRT
jgi:hypothetical protein